MEEYSTTMANENIQWTSEQMIQNAGNWSLAGDVALLNSLKKFSQTLISDTESLSAKVDNLLNTLENVSLKLELTKNEFHSLRNTQFIENRVYEDDETLENDENKPKEKEISEEDKENAIKNSISIGLQVIQKYYDRVEFSGSDSEGEGNEKSYVLQPKDPYADRPLPYLVGTEDWYKKWHVGLLPSESESESEKEEEVYSSDSNSEEFLPKNRNVGSETSSELDFANRNTGPIANSTFNDTQSHRQDMFHSSEGSPEQSNSLPVKTPISNEKFAEQLAAKLGDVISGKSETSGNFNKPTGSTQPSNYGKLFSDEPPPLDESEDSVLPKLAQEGLFSGGKNLFAENNENDLFSTIQEEKAGPAKAHVNEQKPSLFNQPSITNPKVTRSLFDNSDSSSEEDMVTVTEKRRILSATVSNPYMQPYKPTVPFVDDEPPEITVKNENDASKKKPVGGVSVFGPNTNLFASKPSNEPHTNDKVSVENIKKNTAEPPKKSLKKTGLFDESSDDEIFSSKTKNAEAKQPEKSSSVSGSKTLSLFEDSDDFTSQPEEIKNTKSLFDDIVGNPKEAKKEGLFDDINNSNLTSKEITDKDEKILKEETKKISKKISLFDDDDDFYKEEEDIFATAPKKKGLFDDLEEPSSKTNKGLFDDLDDTSLPRDNSSFNGKSLFGNKLENIKGNLTENIEQNIKDKSLFDDFGTPHDNDLFKAVGQTSVASEKKQILVALSDKDEDFAAQGIISNAIIENKIEQPIERNVIHDENADIGKDSFDISHSVEIQKKGNIDFEKLQEYIEPKAQDTSENVSTNIDSVSSMGNIQQTNDKDELNADLEDNKKSILEKIRKNVGLFDSESENSGEEDIFGKNDKVIENSNANPSLPTNNISSIEEKLLVNDSTKNASKANDIIPNIEQKDTMEEGGAVDEEAIKSTPENFVAPPPINLFDPTPPPVDWDASSEHSAESDTFSLTDGILDRTSYNQTQPTSSSLFDEAPPSLDVRDMNYSSGIAGDINTTRVETDDSSFYPHASSSRRLSSDIFSDQQSQDSFFISKNPTETQGQVSSLDKIPEHSEDFTSKIWNLTPSGNPADFDDSTSVFEKSEDESNDKMHTTRPVVSKKPDILQKVSLFSDHAKEKTNNDVVKKSDSSSFKASPGKIKHNLNINVGALLPGAALPKNRPSIVKSVSLDETDKSLSVPPSLDPKPTYVVSRSKSEMFTPKKTESESSEGSNFANLGEIEVLQSVTKDRAKIPIKRRPSTRRARQEAVRRSGTDFNIQNVEEITSEVDSSSSISTDAISVNILLDSNNSDGGIKERDPVNYAVEPSENVKGISLVFDKNTERKTIKSDDKGLFDTSNITHIPEQKDLFGSTSKDFRDSLFEDLNVENVSTIPTPSAHVAAKSALIGDDNENLPKPNESISKTIKPKSIFEEPLEDNGSIFKPTASSKEKHTLSKEIESKTLFESSSEHSDIFDKTDANKKDNIFDAEGSLNDSDEDLFSSKLSKKNNTPAISKPIGNISEKPHKSGLFSDKSDSDSDSDLFSVKSKHSAGVAEKGKQTNASKKNNIFDSDDSSEEDLFGSKTSKSSTSSFSEAKGSTASPKRVEIKTANVKKLENKAATDFDPLSGFK